MSKQKLFLVDVMYGVKRDNLVQALRNQFMLHGLSSDLAADSSAAQIASLLFFAHRKGLLVVGRKEWEKATITRITPKTVMFSGKTGAMYRHGSDELRRGEGCFVIDINKRLGE